MEVHCSHTELWNIEKLVPNPRNPNKHPQKQIELLSKIIDAQGWRNPIVVSKQSGFIVKGEARFEAARLLNLKKVPVDVQEYATEAQEWADLIADNRIAELAEMDPVILKDLLEEIDIGDFDMDLTGFDFEARELFMTQFGVEEIEDDDFDIDKALEEPVISTPGDIWLLGKHRIMCGDTTKKEDVERLMGEEKADIVFTDPPYNVDYGSSKMPHHKLRRIEGDRQNKEAWIEFNKAWIANTLEFYNGGDFYCWGASGPSGMCQRLILIDLGLHWSATIIWKKQHFVFSQAKYQRIYEPCFYGWEKKSTFRLDRKQIEVWEFDRPTRSDEHPTMKPLAVCSYGIKNSSHKDNIILDPFLGSGSTLIACEQLNRICFGMEIDPKYCDVIIKRWEQLTENKAKKLQSVNG